MALLSSRARQLTGAACSITGLVLSVSAFGFGEPPAPASLDARDPVVIQADRADEELDREASALSARWAPTFVQETSREHPERDRPLAIDFDGDWDATNNWENLTPAHRYATPTVYGSAILTRSHAYLTYTLFYPRDWTAFGCLPYICHDNDLETVLLVVERATDGAARERLVLVEAKSHRDYLALPGDAVARDDAGKPVLRVESGGHGMRPVRDGAGSDATNTRVFVHVPVGTSQASAAMRPGVEAYELASLYDSLWKQRSTDAASGRLWTEGETGPLWYAGERAGRLGSPLGAAMATRTYAGGVRPPWGLRAERGARGDWFLDPAHVTLARHSQWFGARSASARSYELNRYLEDLTRECSGSACSAPAPAGARAPVAAVIGSALIALGIAASFPRGTAASAMRRCARRFVRR